MMATMYEERARVELSAAATYKLAAEKAANDRDRDAAERCAALAEHMSAGVDWFEAEIGKLQVRPGHRTVEGAAELVADWARQARQEAKIAREAADNI